MAPAPLTVRRITADEHLAYVRERSDQSSISFLQVPSWAGAKAEWSHASLGWFDADERLVGAGLVLLRQVPRVKRYLAYLPEGPDIDWTGERTGRGAGDESAGIRAFLQQAGVQFDGVELTFKDGEVVQARAESGQEFLLQAIATDEGARRLGEIGIGTNFGIQRPVGAILFDEKIGGTVHLALGRSYPETRGRNESALHWDMICDLRAGGRLTADGEVVLQDGRFVGLPGGA